MPSSKAFLKGEGEQVLVDESKFEKKVYSGVETFGSREGGI